MPHLRALHAELVAILQSDTNTAKSGGGGVGAVVSYASTTGTRSLLGGDAARAAKQELRLIEILRSISELVSTNVQTA